MKYNYALDTTKPVFQFIADTVGMDLDTTLALCFEYGADVGDNTYDVLVNVSAGDKNGDNYDVAIHKINMGVKCLRSGDGYALADVTGWVESHFDLMNEFCREFNKDAYQMDVAEEDQYYEEDDPLYVGVLTWQSLMIGNYSDRAYKWLSDRL